MRGSHQVLEPICAGFWTLKKCDQLLRVVPFACRFSGAAKRPRERPLARQALLLSLLQPL